MNSKIFSSLSLIIALGFIVSVYAEGDKKEWKRLNKGDVQIIRAGSGISHAERLGPGAEMFQIWADPGLENTIGIPASYDDYKSDSFPVIEENGKTIKTYFGAGAPLTMVTPGLGIQEITFSLPEQKFELNKDKFYSIYVIEGKIELKVGGANQNDFILVKYEDEINFNAALNTKVFIIESPVKVDYETYAERYV